MSQMFSDKCWDLESLLEPYACVPDKRVRVPLGLFSFQDYAVAISILPDGAKRVIVTDEGDVLTRALDHGLHYNVDSYLHRALLDIAAKRDFQFDGRVFFRPTSVDEVPTAILHLAEVQIAASGLLTARLMQEQAVQFKTAARNLMEDKLPREVLKRVHFWTDIPKPFAEGDFFCVVDGRKTLGAKLVTDQSNMKDALLVRYLFKQEKLELAALKKPGAKLTGKRVILFESLYKDRIFDKAERFSRFVKEYAEAA